MAENKLTPLENAVRNLFCLTAAIEAETNDIAINRVCQVIKNNVRLELLADTNGDILYVDQLLMDTEVTKQMREAIRMLRDAFSQVIVDTNVQ